MAEARTRKALKNVTYSIMHKLLMLFLTFISRTIFIKVFGIEFLGINSLFSDVLGLLSLADLGLNSAMAFSFYKPLADHDERKISELVKFYKFLYNIIAVVITVIGLLLIPILPVLVNLDHDIPYLTLYYLFALANVVITYLFVYKTTVLTADQNSYVVTRVSMACGILTTTLQIIVMVIFRNYFAYLSVKVFFAFITNYISSKLSEKKYPFINNGGYLGKNEKSNIIKTILSAFVFKISSVLLNATDNILISLIVGTVAVGLYSNYLVIYNQIVAFFSIIFTSVTASVGNLIVKEKADKRYTIFKCEQDICFIFCIVIVPCYTALINDFVLVWLGEEYLFNFDVVIAIGVNLILSSVMQPLWTYREATGLYKKTKYIMIFCAIENLVLSAIMGNLMGLSGIIFASSISRISTYCWVEPRILFKEYFERSPKDYYFRMLANLFLVVILSGIMLVLVNLIPVKGYASWFLEAVVVFTICVLVAFLTYRKSDGIKIIISKINQMKG